MDVVHGFWDENSAMHHHRVKYESCNSNDDHGRLKDERNLYTCCDGNLNFATAANCSEDDSEYGTYKKNKVARQDPMSHRIIEKRRRDRMNNCLADLSRLIPTEYLKKGRGRIEKTEIIEMAIKHMKYLQQEHGSPSEHYRLGYQECMSETMRFMVEVEGHFPREAICVRLLNHLQKHCEALTRSSAPPPVPRPQPADRPSAPRPPSEKEEEFARTAAKGDEEVNNNGVNTGRMIRNSEEEEMYEKQTETNGAMYKYKTDIKLRFNQDLHGERNAKRQKMEMVSRRNSTSTENHSSSHSSPPSSDVYTRHSSESDNNHRISPPIENTASLNHHHHGLHKSEMRNEHNYKDAPQNLINPLDVRTANFNVPVFVLHAKGSFYVPTTIDYKTLLPFLRNCDLLEVLPNVHNIVLHPVTINVNFQPHFGLPKVVGGNGYKSENGCW